MDKIFCLMAYCGLAIDGLFNCEQASVREKASWFTVLGEIGSGSLKNPV